MAATDIAKDQYENITSAYDGIEKLPHSKLTVELVQAGLGDCTGKVILDLGGGSGLHARSALSLGASRVDVVDLYPDMLKNCDTHERSAGREPGMRVRTYQGDATQPLTPLKLPGRDGSGLYDIVMVIWTFDHAETLAQLESMWANTAAYCAPGGKVVSIRIMDPWGRHEETFKYGVKISDLKSVPGGVSFVYSPQADPPFSCEATALEVHYDLEQAVAMAKKYGFDGLEKVDASELKIVKGNPAFWQAFLDYPGFCCVTGTKR